MFCACIKTMGVPMNIIDTLSKTFFSIPLFRNSSFYTSSVEFTSSIVNAMPELPSSKASNMKKKGSEEICLNQLLYEVCKAHLPTLVNSLLVDTNVKMLNCY